MTVVDVHTHFIPGFFVEEAAKSGGFFAVKEEDGWLAHPEGFRYPVQREFVDREAKLAQMDELGIEVSVLSSSPTLFFYEAPAGEAVEFARRSNDALADLVAGSDRLNGLATLPLQAPEAAVDELERSVGELGLLGAQIGTNCGSVPLDAPELEPVLAAADQLRVPLMLHPYYVGPKPGLEQYYLTNSIGNPLDTCVAAARLMHSGAFDRFPRLQVVLVHAGGFMPYQLGRLDHAFAVRREPREHTDRPPSAYLDRFWLDTITHSDGSLEFLVSTVGAGRVVLGTDLPFDMADAHPLDRLERAGVDPHALGANAAELLGLGQASTSGLTG
jgi:aminocarboxymuconate-semialdehyde decarboxylase